MTCRALLFITIIACSLYLGACDEHAHQDAPHGDHPHGPDGEHVAHERPTEAVTRWGETTQLFVEFPVLVRGQESAFAAHLTMLNDHSALKEGQVTVVLSGGLHPPEEFSSSTATQPGIFRPVITPVHAGLRQVTLRLEQGLLNETHELGSFMVFDQPSEAVSSTPQPGEGAIAFYLEQQWSMPFGLAQARTRAISANVEAFAQIVLPEQSEALITSPREGRILSASDDPSLGFAQVGDTVSRGETLYTIQAALPEGEDPATLQLALTQANLSVESAQYELDRVTPLVAQGVIAAKRLEGARLALEQARAAQRSAQRRRGMLGQSQRVKGRTDGFKVPSPLDGTISELLVTPGVWVTQGQPLARLIDRDTLWLEVEVPESYVPRIKTLTGVWAQFAGSEELMSLGRDALISTSARLDPVRRTMSVRFQLQGSTSSLLAGMTTMAHIRTDEPRQVVTIPYSAVIDDAGVQVVYVQTSGELFERRAVKLGEREGPFVEVLHGVTAEEWVVSQGAYVIRLASTSPQTIGHGHAH